MKKLLVSLLLTCALVALAGELLAQSTPGGTVITNRASATYSDGTNNFTTVSNTVTTTVSNVAGISITPDRAGSCSSSVCPTAATSPTTSCSRPPAPASGR
jgi:hypothetical protein